MLSKTDEALNLLESIISQDLKYKAKAKNSKSFNQLKTKIRFYDLTT